MGVRIGVDVWFGLKSVHLSRRAFDAIHAADSPTIWAIYPHGAGSLRKAGVGILAAGGHHLPHHLIFAIPTEIG